MSFTMFPRANHALPLPSNVSLPRYEDYRPARGCTTETKQVVSGEHDNLVSLYFNMGYITTAKRLRSQLSERFVFVLKYILHLLTYV